jgi:hypothetical protein
MERLTQWFAEALEHLLALGFKPPIRLAAVAVNGSVIVVSYDCSTGGRMDCQFLAEYSQAEGFQLPINMMYVDQRGEAARFLIAKSEDRPMLIQ